MPRKRLDLTGKRFGRLTVLAPAEDKRLPSGETSSQWRCRCDCGRETVVARRNLRFGATTSCGRCDPRRPMNARRRDEAVSESAQRVHELPSNPFADLANAIVACAADDYRTALKEGDRRSLASLERFFHSRWYALLTSLDPDRLISRLKAEA